MVRRQIVFVRALVHYVALWSIEIQWHVDRVSSAREGMATLFQRTAGSVRAARWLMPEIIQYQFRAAAPEEGLVAPPPPTLADKQLHFAPLAGAESLEPRGVHLIIRDLLGRAASGGELRGNADRQLAEQLLVSLFFGASASSPDPDVVANTMVQGLDTLWKRFATP